MKRKCPKCGTADALCIGVEYGPMDKYHHDGISEWRCGNMECDYRQGRFCGQPLTGAEVEPRFCDGKNGHPRIFNLN